jgi:hypothetical protein
MSKPNRRDVPSSVLEKLMALDDGAKAAAVKVAKAEAAIASLRSRLEGVASFEQQQQYLDARRALDEMVAELPFIRGEADAAQSTHRACRSWFFAERKLREHCQQAAGRLEHFVGQCGRGGGPHLDLGAGFAMPVNCWQAPSDWWAFLCWHSPETAVAALRRVLDAKLAKLPFVSENVARLATIGRELERLAHVEQALGGYSALPQAVLGVRIAKEQMAEERAKRIERRVTHAG